MTAAPETASVDAAWRVRTPPRITPTTTAQTMIQNRNLIEHTTFIGFSLAKAGRGRTHQNIIVILTIITLSG